MWPDTPSPAQKPKPATPHWSTYVTPVASVFIALISLYIAWDNQRTNRYAVRPFLVVEFDQRRIGAASFDTTKQQLSDEYFAWGIITIKNVGGSPAYGVYFKIQDQGIGCVSLSGPVAIAAHDSYVVNPEVCDTKAYKPSADPKGYTMYNVKGTISFRDAYGTEYNEKILIRIQFGGLELWHNRL
jgi:hypothetical protein